MKKIGLVFWLFSSLIYAQNDPSFNRANDFYNSGDYNSAISTYKEIIESGLHSAELYYNLANCYYKLNKVAPSIYYYEKALLLNPNDTDLLNNLSFAKKMTVDKIDDVPELGLVKLAGRVIHLYSADQWAVICIFLMVFFVLFFITYYFTKKTKSKRLFFIFQGIVLVLLIISFGLMTKKFDLEKNIKHGIVFSQEIELKSEPNLKSETIFFLHEGTKIRLLEPYSDSWTKIQLNDGKVGWLPNNAFKEL